jgi:hypothetical protein
MFTIRRTCATHKFTSETPAIILLGPPSFGFFSSIKAGKNVMSTSVDSARYNRSQIRNHLQSFENYYLILNITVSIAQMVRLRPIALASSKNFRD